MGFDNKNGQKRSETFLVHFTGFSVVWINYPENQHAQVLEKLNIEGNSKSRFMFRSMLPNLIVSFLSQDENKL